MALLRAALVVALALPIAGFVATVAAPGAFRITTGRPAEFSAKHDFARIRDAVDAFRLRFGRLPAPLGEIVAPPDDDPLVERLPLDAWGRAYVLVAQGGSDYDILSFGADGEPGGEGANADFSYEQAVSRQAAPPK